MFKEHLSKKRSYKIIKEGYLFKESYHFKQLRNRWIVLNKQYIDCYKDNVSEHTTEELDLDTFSDIRACINQTNAFELIPKEMNNPSRTFVASSERDMNDWITRIKQCILSIEQEDANVRNAEEWHSTLTDLSAEIKRVDRETETDRSYGSEQKTPELSISSLNLNPPCEDEPEYTESDIQQLSVWYTKELQKLEQQHRTEKQHLMSRMDGLLRQLNDLKRKHSSHAIQKRLQHLSAQKDAKYKSHIGKLKQERDALKNEIQQRDKRLEIGEEKTRCKSHENERAMYNRGLLIFQQQRVSVQQLYDMSSYYKVCGMSKAPKIIFGDNDILEKYDKRICYKIKTTFRASDADQPTLYDFRVMMNRQFDVLQQYLMRGHDVIVPLPTAQDVEVNGHERFHKNNRQIIYHRIGIHKELQLPILFIEFIQNKIDQLTKYCSSTQIVQRYVYDKVNYKPDYKPSYKALPNSESKPPKVNRVKATEPPKAKPPNKRVVVGIWQWRNSHNQWISYDDNTCREIEELAIHGVYEYNSNSFITKLSKEGGIEVDTKTEHRRDVQRILKPMIDPLTKTKPT